MSLDRAASLRQAEKLLRQGNLDQAVAEYRRLVDEQPRDWNTANLLGDLYVRAGHLDQAIAQFSRIAESLRAEGFLPRASALYKKALKLKPDADHALVRAGELAAEQGLLADARTFLTAAASGRRHRGDARGALQLIVKLGSLDRDDISARLAGARARQELDDMPGALHDLHDLAFMLIEDGRDTEAVGALRQITSLDPANAPATRELARILIAQGNSSEAAMFLTLDAVGSDARLLLIAAELRLRCGDAAVGLEMVDRLLTLDLSAANALVDVALSIAAEQPVLAFTVVERIADQAAARADWAGAAEALRRFVVPAPNHVAALTRLVDACVEGALPDGIIEAQSWLADAFLASGATAQAKYVAEDLLTRQPWERAHISRLKAALVAEGQDDPDRALADWLAEPAAFGLDADAFGEAIPGTTLSLPPVESGGQIREAESAIPPAPASVNPHAIDLDVIFGSPAASPALVAGSSFEEDLSVVLDDIGPPAPPVPLSRRPSETGSDAPKDIEAVFAQLRESVSHGSLDESADAACTRGAAMFEAGEFDLAIEQLRVAARSPRRRFTAASLLARVYEQQQRVEEALEWLRHAADAPETSRLERFDTMFRLADLLERSRESASALAVYLELQADAGDYRDVAVRIARLSRAQAGG